MLLEGIDGSCRVSTQQGDVLMQVNRIGEGGVVEASVVAGSARVSVSPEVPVSQADGWTCLAIILPTLFHTALHSPVFFGINCI